MVEFVVLVSKVFPAGDVAVDDDGDNGAVAEFAALVLFVVEFEFWSACSYNNRESKIDICLYITNDGIYLNKIA